MGTTEHCPEESTSRLHTAATPHPKAQSLTINWKQNSASRVRKPVKNHAFQTLHIAAIPRIKILKTNT